MENIASLTKKLKEMNENVEILKELSEQVEVLKKKLDNPVHVISSTEPQADVSAQVKQLETVLARVMHQTGTSTLLKNTTIQPFEPTKKDMSKYNA